MGTVVLQNIEKWYGQTRACTDINLKIEDGQFFTFLGPSGCGKTAILRLIAGFMTPNKGSISLSDVDITSLEPEKRNVGMVFQNYALFPFMTVLENIGYGLKVQKLSKPHIKKKTERYLSIVGLEGLEDRQISELSGGEQQRVALARSLAIEPKVLLLDEPLSNLDARLRENMRSELKRLQAKLGITTIFVTHDQTEALTMSDKLAVFKEGRCIQTGTPEEIYKHPKDSFVAQFIGETNILPICLGKNIHLPLMNIILRGVNYDPGHHVSIRPQCIMVSTHPADSDFSFAGIVEEKRYTGLTTEMTVRVEGYRFRSVKINSNDGYCPPHVGQSVFINFSASDLRILKN